MANLRASWHQGMDKSMWLTFLPTLYIDAPGGSTVGLSPRTCSNSFTFTDP